MTDMKKPRGFAAMSPDVRSAIARKGGRTAHRLGVAHQWDHDEGQAAGRKGGLARGENLRRRLAAARATSEDAWPN